MKLLEAASYAALVLVCCLAGFKLVQYHPQQVSAAIRPSPTVPASISGQIGVDLTTRKKWAVLVLSTQCHFCIQSAPFHHELVKMLRNSTDVGVVAVFPQNRTEVEQYEAAHDLAFPNAISDASLIQLQVRGTPTLLLVDQQGKVLKHWAGLLPESSQNEVRAELGLKPHS